MNAAGNKEHRPLVGPFAVDHECFTYPASFTRGEFYAECSCGFESAIGSLTAAEGAAREHLALNADRKAGDR